MCRHKATLDWEGVFLRRNEKGHFRAVPCFCRGVSKACIERPFLHLLSRVAEAVTQVELLTSRDLELIPSDAEVLIRRRKDGMGTLLRFPMPDGSVAPDFGIEVPLHREILFDKMDRAEAESLVVFIAIGIQHGIAVHLRGERGDEETIPGEGSVGFIHERMNAGHG